jgi:hypothetical protein
MLDLQLFVCQSYPLDEAKRLLTQTAPLNTRATFVFVLIQFDLWGPAAEHSSRCNHIVHREE